MERDICRAKDAKALDECRERYLKRCRSWCMVRCLGWGLRILGERVAGRVTPFVKVISINVGCSCKHDEGLKWKHE